MFRSNAGIGTNFEGFWECWHHSGGCRARRRGNYRSLRRRLLTWPSGDSWRACGLGGRKPGRAPRPVVNRHARCGRRWRAPGANRGSALQEKAVTSDFLELFGGQFRLSAGRRRARMGLLMPGSPGPASALSAFNLPIHSLARSAARSFDGFMLISSLSCRVGASRRGHRLPGRSSWPTGRSEWTGALTR